MKNYRRFLPSGKVIRNGTLMSLLMLGFLLCLPSVMAIGQNKVDLKVAQGNLREIFSAIQQQTNYRFLYSTEDIKNVQVSQIDLSGADISDVMASLLRGTGLTWQINDDIISVKKTASSAQQQPTQITITGQVTNNAGNPVPGVTVRVKNSKSGTITDGSGKFIIIPQQSGTITLVFSFVGMETQEVAYKNQPVNVVMRESVQKIDEIIVTGIFERSRENFTGSATVYSAAELRSVGNQNILQSLRTLDPSFAIIENNEFGSDPNTMPNIEIRGRTSITGLVDDYNTSPNQPLFIVDEFERSLSYVVDMSMDMVENITILKDAASTAIYGSKAANGVVVITTKRPEPGRIKVRYNADFIISFPDLTDYNLMNATEKLEYERLSLQWGQLNANGSLQNSSNEVNYMKILEDIQRGVNTYWLHLPLRVGFTNKHSIFLDGGTDEFRYGIQMSYGNNQPVMKGSSRETLAGNVRLEYENGQFKFENNLSINNLVSDREKVEFSRFALMNPYLRKYNEYGDLVKMYNYMNSSYYAEVNPLWDMDLSSFNRTKEFDFTNRFSVKWYISRDLLAQTSFSVGKTTGNNTIFLSPLHTSFIGKSAEETGSYTRNDSDTFLYNGEFRVSYGKLLNDVHLVNIDVGFNFRNRNALSSQYIATGFLEDDYPNPSAAQNYKPDSRPVYTESTVRSSDYYFTMGYTYDRRYNLSASYRLDGSSIFGVSKHFKTTYSVGLGWNIHNESFMENFDIEMLKLRGSIGNPGSQNFNDYISERVYKYENLNTNMFGTGLVINNFGNKNLEWQKTTTYTVGIDFVGINRRLSLSADYYYKVTDPLLIYLGTPTSTGTDMIPTNLGSLHVKGFDAKVNYRIISHQNLMWSANFSVAHNTAIYHNFGNSLERFNEKNRASTSLLRYYDGGSDTAIWAVRSLGIDPATGKEIFLKKDGTQSFQHDPKDEVVVGDERADIEGVIGSRLSYKGFSANVNFRYKLGGQIFMSALYDKVEDISGNLGRFHNQDKRALYDRWIQIGDETKFIGISQSANPKTSRFVMDNNVFSCESISLSYDLDSDWMTRLGIASMRFTAYMNDIFRISTIKNERGIEYPFARSVSFNVSLRF